jgi:(p)ppGpp synthase/HD superfamily hydrolase
MEELERRACEFARAAHAGQTYTSGSFHDKHLARVVATLRRYGIDEPRLLAAAWLHDTVEDTDVTIEAVEQTFGADVADLVWRLTDEPGKNRRERHELTHRKIRGRSEAVGIKLADRIANVQSSAEERSHLRGMYRAEYPQFRADLYRAGEFDELWAELDRLLALRKTS